MLNWLGSKFAKLRAEIDANVFDLKVQVASLRHEVSRIKLDAPLRTGLPPFPVPDATEPSVAVALRDFVKSGATVFDVGAHVGALSSIMSRRVGPRGLVVAFEANPGTARTLCANMIAKGHFNVWIVPEAISAQPNTWVHMEESGAASRLGASGYRVPATSLDHVCAEHNLAPTFLKIDIEGEEYNALSGASALLGIHKPVLIFEHNMGDDRVIALLREKGYVLYDVATYKPIAASSDYEPGVQVSNILAIHTSKLAESRYAEPPQSTLVETFGPQRFAADSSRPSVLSVSADLATGRYIFLISQVTLNRQVDLFCCVKNNGVVLGHLATNGDFFIHNHRALPFHAESRGQFTFEFGEVEAGETKALQVHEVQLWRVDFKDMSV